MTVRKGVARGVQGATNLTHNQLSQHVMKLAQEQEGLGKKKKRRGKQSPAAVAAGLATDIEMAA